MDYYEVLEKICSRCNDPLMERLKEQAKGHFLDAIYGIIDSGEYVLEDIPAYFKVEQGITFTTGEYDLTAKNVYKVLDVFPDPTGVLTGATTVRFSIKDMDIISRMANNKELQPSVEDYYIYRVGNTLYSFQCADPNTYSGNIYMTYIQNIDDSAWDSSESSATDLAPLFSTKILSKAISIAAVNLIKEDSL